MAATQYRYWAKGLLLAGGLLLLMPQGAQAEIWCRRDFDRNNPACVFSSARDCVRAASLMGGICERETLARATAAKPCKPARATGRTAKRGPADPAFCGAG